MRTDRVKRSLQGHHDRTDARRGWHPDPPTGKSFDLDFYTVAQWDNGQIVEENLMYDLVTFMKQIGLGG